jgi:hypothetical protein
MLDCTYTYLHCQVKRYFVIGALDALSFQHLLFLAGDAILGDYQFYPGYTVFLSKSHVTELHDLEKRTGHSF